MLQKIFNPKSETLVLFENDYHIWNVDVDIINKQKELLQQILSKNELLRASKFYFEIDKDRFICSRGFLRLLISAYTGISPNTLSFVLNDFGKPELSNELNNRQLSFNVSHSKNRFCVALAKNHPIGIDIEIVKPIPNHMKIATRYFSQSEIEQLTSFADNEALDGFYTCWTSKEAVIKLLGKGLSFPLKDFDVHLRKLGIGKTYQYMIRVKHQHKIISVEVFRTQRDVYGACALGLDSFKTIYWIFEDSTFSVNNFVADYRL